MAPHLGRPTGTRERQVPQNNGVKRKLTGERGLERDECHCDVWTGAGKFGVVRGLHFASQSREECVVTLASCLPAWLWLQPDYKLKWKYPSKGISGSKSSWLVGGKGYYLITDSGSQCRLLLIESTCAGNSREVNVRKPASWYLTSGLGKQWSLGVGCRRVCACICGTEYSFLVMVWLEL